MKPILEIKGVSKKFKLQQERAPYLSLRDSLSSLFTKKKRLDEDYWALDDISFEVQQGDSVGIIGRNGAGKSTLLKVLSKITPPTSGCIISRGRIASLLEVGTGFHPELSGRENIFLNGSILGLQKSEISKQFDAIVDFSGVEKFLDTPLKHYSSGMQLRLAFAVAAHLEPEILIIDEVLAVGDAEFQKKCMGKMDEVSNSGRTILFVSHNMGVITSLCKKGIVLNNGKLDYIGDSKTAVDKYLSLNSENNFDLRNIKNRKGNGWLRFEEIFFTNSKNEICTSICSGDDLNINLKYKLNPEKLKNRKLNFAIAISTSSEIQITDLGNVYHGLSYKNLPEEGVLTCSINRIPLSQGRFYLNVFSEADGEILDWVLKASYFDVEEGDFYKVGKGVDTTQSLILFDYTWKS